MKGGKSGLSVLHVCAPAEFGGLERVIQSLTRGLAARGHNVTVAAVIEPGSDVNPFLAPIREAGVHTVVLELPRRAYLRELREIAGLLERIRPDVLHTHGHRADLLHPLRARSRGIATVTTLHGFTSSGGYSNFMERAQQRALRGFDGVVAVSRPLVDTIAALGVRPTSLHHVPNAWEAPEAAFTRSEARAYLEENGSGKLIGWVGRLASIKGPDVFIRSLAELVRIHPQNDWRACLLGDGPDRTALEALAVELGIADRVRFCGVVHDAPRVFSAFDAFVLSSRSEGTPMALLEAMGLGIPVVATTVGGVPDVLDGVRQGWLVPPDSPNALATCLREAIQNEAEARERGLAGRLRVAEAFGPDAWVVKHEEIYRSVADVSGR